MDICVSCSKSREKWNECTLASKLVTCPRSVLWEPRRFLGHIVVFYGDRSPAALKLYRQSTQGKKKTSSHWHRNRCSRKKSEIVFVYKHFKRNFLDLWPPFNFVQIRHWRTNLLKWWRSTCCAYASDIIWSFGLWIINVASKMSSVLITAYTQTCVTTLLPVTAHHTQRYTWIVSQQLHSSETRKRNKKQPICKKQKQAGHICIDTQEMTSQSTGNGRL